MIDPIITPLSSVGAHVLITLYPTKECECVVNDTNMNEVRWLVDLIMRERRAQVFV